MNDYKNQPCLFPQSTSTIYSVTSLQSLKIPNLGEKDKNTGKRALAN